MHPENRPANEPAPEETDAQIPPNAVAAVTAARWATHGERTPATLTIDDDESTIEIPLESSPGESAGGKTAAALLVAWRPNGRRRTRAPGRLRFPQESLAAVEELSRQIHGNSPGVLLRTDASDTSGNTVIIETPAGQAQIRTAVAVQARNGQPGAPRRTPHAIMAMRPNITTKAEGADASATTPTAPDGGAPATAGAPRHDPNSQTAPTPATLTAEDHARIFDAVAGCAQRGNRSVTIRYASGELSFEAESPKLSIRFTAPTVSTPGAGNSSWKYAIKADWLVAFAAACRPEADPDPLIISAGPGILQGTRGNLRIELLNVESPEPAPPAADTESHGAATYLIRPNRLKTIINAVAMTSPDNVMMTCNPKTKTVVVWDPNTEKATTIEQVSDVFERTAPTDTERGFTANVILLAVALWGIETLPTADTAVMTDPETGAGHVVISTAGYRATVALEQHSNQPGNDPGQPEPTGNES